MNIEIARLQSVSDRVMEVDITSHGVWKSLSLLFQCTDAGLIAILFASPLGEGDFSFLGAKIPDPLRMLKFSRASLSQSKFHPDDGLLILHKSLFGEPEGRLGVDQVWKGGVAHRGQGAQAAQSWRQLAAHRAPGRQGGSQVAAEG